ncbi:MAG TPA: DUF294 nucleotidyltransferase-like domain-containing protein [Terriglobales bacterium]|nr:DUF294 nucleotidyltransferase-like domain-containing protein [Terriglobales bacterium]
MASSSHSVVTESVISFLQNVPPFEFLPSAELATVARTMSLEYFPKDSTILSAGNPASEALYIVQKGAVKLAIRTQVGKELIIDMRSEGEFFGLLSFLGRDIARLDVTAVEDTLCYAISSQDMQKLMSRHRDVSDYLLRTSVTRYVDRSLNELRSQTNLMGSSERLLYALSVRDVAKVSPLLCPGDTSIRDVAKLMSQRRSSSVFVIDENKNAVGIVTDRDLAEKVVARGMSPDLPVTKLMTSPVIAVDEGDPVFNVLLTMLGRNIHHVLVTSGGFPKGILTSHDLMLLQGKSPLNVVEHIDQQQTLEGLANAHKRVSDLLPLLLREGAKASHVTRVIAEMNDRLLARILNLAEEKLGPPPVSYCWVVLGSEGRREQTFKTDQDNAIIYADVEPTNKDSVSAYFADFASFIESALQACGYPPCPGNYMATNSRWRQPLSTWQGYFDQWISGAETHDTEDALIFFDMRPIAGDLSLFRSLSAHVQPRVKEAAFFKSILAYISTQHKPPLGFFRTFVLERSGEHKSTLDVKLYGTGPIVNAARLFAIDVGVEASNTAERLRAIKALAYADPPLIDDLCEAFEFLTMLRIEHQLRQVREAKSPDNYIAPDTLTTLQKSLLKESFHSIARAQSFIEDRFRSAVWAQLGR